MKDVFQLIKQRRLSIGIFLFYMLVLLINYWGHVDEQYHPTKGGEMIFAAIYQSILAYFFILFIRLGVLSFLGLGFFAGIAGCFVALLVSNLIPFKSMNYQFYILCLQLIASIPVLLLGIFYYKKLIPIPPK